jgi:hypothetical protein
MTKIEISYRDFPRLKQDYPQLEEPRMIIYPVPHQSTLAFLNATIETGVYAEIPEDVRKIIGMYYFIRRTKLSDLTKEAGVEKAGEVKRLILEAMEKMWDNLPSNIKDQYPKTKAIRLKSSAFDPAYRKKMSKTLTGRPRDPKTVTKMAEGVKAVWQDPKFRERRTKTLAPTHRDRIANGIREFHIERRLWEFSLENLLIPVFIEKGLLSKEEAYLLKKHFRGDENTRRRHLPKGIFDRLSQAVAKVS